MNYLDSSLLDPRPLEASFLLRGRMAALKGEPERDGNADHADIVLAVLVLTHDLLVISVAQKASKLRSTPRDGSMT